MAPFDTSGLVPADEPSNAMAPRRGAQQFRGLVPAEGASAGGIDTSGLVPADDAPDQPREVTLLAPTTDDDGRMLSRAGNYFREFGKAVVRGAADLGGTALKFGAAAQTVAARDMQRYAQRRLDAIARLERGEAVDPSDDPDNYLSLVPAERAAIKQRLTGRLTQFDLPGGVQDRDLYQAGNFVSEAGRRAAPVGAGFEDSVTSNLGQGVGSVGAGLPIALAGPGAAALVFGGAGGGEALERAVQHGASEDDQLKAAILGVGPGATDVAPIELLLRSHRITAPFSRPLANAILRIGGNAFVEGIQEGGQQWLQNLIAREVYKPEQNLGEGVIPNTGLGAGVGGITGTAVELARMFGGRRGVHAQPHTRPQEVGSPIESSAADSERVTDGVSRGWRPDTGRNAFAAGAPNPGRETNAVEQGRLAGRSSRSADTTRIDTSGLVEAPMFALGQRDDRLLYSGSGEAPARKFRRFDRTSLEVNADRLTRAIGAYHDELAASGASPADIATGISATFGIDVSPADVANGDVWWRLPRGGSIAPTETVAPARLASPDLTAAQRNEITRLSREEGIGAHDIAQRLGVDPIKVGAVVQAAKPRDARSSLTYTEDLFTHPDLAGLTAREAAARVSKVLGRPIAEGAIYKARQSVAAKGVELPRMGGRSESSWSDAAIAEMQASFDSGMNAPQVADRLNARFPDFGGTLNANAIRLRKSKLARGLTPGGRAEPQFAIGAQDPMSRDKAELLREWGKALDEWADTDTSLRPVERRTSRSRGGVRPIDWDGPAIRDMLEGRSQRRSGGPRPSEFAWPAEAMQMIRNAEGRQSFAELAAALSERFRVPISRDMVGAKVRRLRGLGEADRQPLLAASNDPEGWLARFRSAKDAERTDAQDASRGLDPQGRAISGWPPGAQPPAGIGTGRYDTRSAAGSVERVDLGRFSGVVVETPSVVGLRQRRYWLFSPNAEIPGLGRSPGVAQRVLKTTRTWIAKAHLIETQPGKWDVVGINVRRNRQRRGIGAELFDHLGRELGVELSPSQSMTQKLYRFWAKRSAQAVAAYQRIGDLWHSPQALRSMKRVNDELLRDPPTPRDALYARTFAKQIDEAVKKAEGLPDWAMSDVDGRRHVVGFIRAGRSLTIPEPVVARVLEAIEKSEHVLPEGTAAGALVRIDPIKGKPPYPGADSVATFRQPNGETFTVDMPVATLATARALYDNFTGSVGFTRFGLFSGLDQSIAGEAHHEAIHGLRRKGILRGALWDRLVSHADNLRLLDGGLATYLQMVGDPAHNKARQDLTLRDAYRRIYRNLPDFSERMDQESVAHMMELYVHGQLLPQEVAPVRDILDRIVAGDFAASEGTTRATEFTGLVPAEATGGTSFALSNNGEPPPIAPSGPPALPPMVPGSPGARGSNPSLATIRALNSWGTSLVEFLQNSEERMRILVDRVGQGGLPDNADPYLQATLYPGRVSSRVGWGHDMAEGIIRDAARLARRSGASHAETRATINDYLIARHAPERNRQHGNGAAGMTDAEAAHTMARINARPDAQDIKALADRISALHTLSLDFLESSGVLSPQLYQRLRAVYQHHVPLNRIMPDTPDPGGAISGRGFDVYSTGIKRAKGSDLEVNDILGNVLANFEQTILRSEKNLVDLASLEFVRKHRKDLQGLLEEAHPPIIGQGKNGPIYQQTQDPRILHMFESGKPVWIRFGDSRLAAAFRGTNRETLPTILEWVAKFTRLYAGLMTRFNPEFALPNKMRDLQETAVYIASQKQLGAKGAAKLAARDPLSVKAVLDYLAGRNTPGAKLYQEMINAGGTTGGMALSTREKIGIDIAKLDRLANSSPRRFARGVVELVDNWNTIFEDSTRLSVYRTAREEGLSQPRAAFLAKEASINFNRQGTAGPVINGLYMFANASIQGSAKMIRSLANPKVAAAVGVTVAVAVAAVTEWNDDVDPEWRDKVSKWDRLNGLPIVLPNENGEGVRYVTIPVSWGLKPLMVAASAAYDGAKGLAVDWAKATKDILVSMVEAYNPAGGTDLGQALMPTIGDTPLDIGFNRKWSGQKIRPDSDPNLPADKQYFLSLKNTQSGRAAIRTTEKLRDYTGVQLSPADLVYAVEQYVGGAGRFGRKVLDAAIGLFKGEPPPADEYPMLSRFYRQQSAEEVGRAAQPAIDIKARLEAQSRQRFDQRSAVDDFMREIETLPVDQQRQKLIELHKSDRELFGKVRKDLQLKERGLSPIERKVMHLGVENGERARYLVDEFLFNGGHPTNWKQKLRELRRKEIVTPKVMHQMRDYMRGIERQRKQDGANGIR